MHQTNSKPNRGTPGRSAGVLPLGAGRFSASPNPFPFVSIRQAIAGRMQGKMAHRIAWRISCLMLVLFFARIAWSEDTPIVSLPAGECTLSVEANDSWRTLRLRAHHPECRSCQITEKEMNAALKMAFSKTKAPRLSESYASLFIGRLIDYPWLSRHLADYAFQDKQWNARKGKPAVEGINEYVSRVLFDKKLLAETEAVLAQAGYKITGVTVEKALVESFRKIPSYSEEDRPGKAPYDAQVWFRLKKK